MSQESSSAAPEIKGMESGQDSGGIETPAAEGVLLKRRRRRRLDLRTLNGTLRESAKIYRELAEGRLSLGAAEVRSRILRRHGELLGTVEQQKQLEALQEQLAALQGRTPGGSFLLPAGDDDEGRR